MARISIWLLTTVAAFGLTNAVPVPGGDEGPAGTNTHDVAGLPDLSEDFEPRYNYGELIESLRLDMGLDPMNEQPDVVGLHTLIAGTQIDYRYMTHKFKEYLESIALGWIDTSSVDEEEYPDLFRKYLFRDSDLTPFKVPRFNIWFETIDPFQIKHDFVSTISGTYSDFIIDYVKALFKVLNSDGLVNNFKAIADLGSKKQQAGQNIDSASQKQQDDSNMDSIDEMPSVTNKALTKNFDAYMHWMWLEVIGGQNAERLRYYLRNMMVFNVIPRILGQVLESSQERSNAFNKALGLAKVFHRLTQL
ncbi:hypothetical protein H4R35_000762 [Dimargaris xerosporica]|nr:hypothetical protein H4R35_000762 [Dimargaris xerosporica]